MVQLLHLSKANAEAPERRVGDNLRLTAQVYQVRYFGSTWRAGAMGIALYCQRGKVI